MKYCRFCGKQVSENAKFCNSCGKDLRVSKQQSPVTQKRRRKPAIRQTNRVKKKSPKTLVQNEALQSIDRTDLFESKLKPKLERLDDKFQYLKHRNDYLASDYFALVRQINEIEAEIENPLFSKCALKSQVHSIMQNKTTVEMRILEYLCSELIYDPLFETRKIWYENKEEYNFLMTSNEIIMQKQDLMLIIKHQIREIFNSIKHSNDRNQINISTFYANFVDVRENVQILEESLHEIAELMEKSPFNEMVDDTYNEIEALIKLLELHSVRHETFSMAQLNAVVNDIFQTVSFEIKQLTRNFQSNEVILKQLKPQYEQSRSNYLAIMKQIFDKGIYKNLPRQKLKISNLEIKEMVPDEEINMNAPDPIHEDLQSLQYLKTLNKLDGLSQLSPLE